MTLREIIERMDLEILTSGVDLDRLVPEGYCGDLLSNVLAAASPGSLWITIQHHVNVIGVAQVAELGGVLLAAGAQPLPSVVQKAEEIGVPLLRASQSAFELAGILYSLIH